MIQKNWSLLVAVFFLGVVILGLGIYNYPNHPKTALVCIVAGVLFILGAISELLILSGKERFLRLSNLKPGSIVIFCGCMDLELTDGSYLIVFMSEGRRSGLRVCEKEFSKARAFQLQSKDELLVTNDYRLKKIAKES